MKESDHLVIQENTERIYRLTQSAREETRTAERKRLREKVKGMKKEEEEDSGTIYLKPLPGETEPMAYHESVKVPIYENIGYNQAIDDFIKILK